ncbi:hypothetical protein A2Z33_00600 [Candidatus Gottesmanbacteria bacterium RBG_16_52_11]|uniref:Uncharacterized protein n=1 Tax=Candidatus Gottesmanbacteria bacterium RBG_16_52_11 TaxID=1798374 RepID=A0A1F5YMW0_9BACT|nr:MAG: hypothetical protein A2Z33_00600 [Candidatus Gottesmanbacteria bacterium RBG_16_52_11]
MGRSFARIRGLGFVMWHSRHELYHIMLGLIWAWVLREWWNEFNIRWIFLSAFASVLPDADHLLYFFTYGRSTSYTLKIREFLKTRQWRNLTVFIENGHKYNTNLSLHNYYVMAGLLGLSLLSTLVDWKVGTILFGAMLQHYLFDIFDDLLTLGSVNSNWKRWGRQ